MPGILLVYINLLIILTGCGGGGSQSPDPVVLDLPIAYVKRPIILNNNVPVQPVATVVLTFNAGADLWIRDRASSSAAPRNITGAITTGSGDVKDVEASYDGTMLVFAMREADVGQAVTPTWNIWLYHIKNKTLKRVISDSITAESGEDLAPYFLPNGNIIFSSTRQSTSKVVRTDEGPINNNNKQAYTGRDESRNEPALSLHVMTVDCSSYTTCNVTGASDISQVTFNQSHDLDPTVLRSGQVIFTRWDHAGSRNAMHLYRSNPDGTAVKLVYGRQSHTSGTPGTTVQFLQPREMPDGRVLSILRPFTGTFGGGDIIATDVANYTDNTRPILPNQLSPITTGQVSLVNNNVTTTTAPSPGGRYSTAYPLWDGSGRILVSWTPCRLLENTIIVNCTTARLAAPGVQEANPLYGLYIFDPATKTQLPIFLPEENIVYSDLVVAEDRTITGSNTVPGVIATKVPGIDPELNLNLANRNTGILHIRSVYDVDGVFNNSGMSAANRTALNNAANTDPDNYATLYNFSLDNRRVAYLADPGRFTPNDRPARFLRIIKGVAIPFELNGVAFNINNNAFGQSAGQGMRDIIGYAPIEPDGSVMVEVPANIPLAISVVDRFGRRISRRHQSWIQVKPGETVTCNGCHNANPNTVNPADGIHGHTTEPVGSNAGAPQNGYIYPGTSTNPLIVGDTISGQTTGETMAQARLGNNCTKSAGATCPPDFDIVYTDIWTNLVVTPFSYEFRQLLPGEIIPLTGNCYDSIGSINKWEYRCRNVINYPETIQPMWTASRGVAGADTCTNCHTAANQRLDLTNTVNGNLLLSYTQLFNGTTVLQQSVDGACNPIFLDPPANTMPLIITLNIPSQMSVNGALQSAFFGRFATFTNTAPACETVDHTSMLSNHEKKFLYEWLDIGGQFYNDPTNANVPVN